MPPEKSTRRRFLKLAGGGLTAGLAGCAASNAQTPTETQTPGSRPEATPEGSVYTQVYRDTIQSVVLVQTDSGQGTGFMYDDAHAVTNAHVVGRASSVQVRFNEGTWSEGSVRGADLHSDLAVVRVDDVPEPASALPFTEQPPVIGQEVLAIGNPYNLNGSMTNGIVSGTDRLIPAPSGYRIPDAIQTDAAVNPGNSGGPLMSVDRRVVGVVNSKRGDNIAFGISPALTQRVVPSLIDSGEYNHAYMGVSLDNVTPTVARANDLAEPRGLLVVQTVRNGPADGVLQESRAEIVDGSRVPVGGDVILSVDGEPMSSFEDLASYLALHTRPGQTVTLAVLRNGEERSVDLELASRPERSESPLR